MVDKTAEICILRNKQLKLTINKSVKKWQKQ